MSAVAPPFRFLGLVIGSWICGRAAFLLLSSSATAVEAPGAPDEAAPISRRAWSSVGDHEHAHPELVEGSLSIRPFDLAQDRFRQAQPERILSIQTKSALAPPLPEYRPVAAAPVEAPVQPFAPLPPTSSQASRSPWSGSAWLFIRSDGNGSGLATGGQLGGSQAGARIAYRAGKLAAGTVAIAARVSSPLRDSRGLEAAAGIDWYPVDKLPMRLSIERRVAIGREARDAWSAYAAGGFWRGGLPAGMEADGYAQAGVVGARRRDLFADGALRLGMPVQLDEDKKLLLGGGIWGAAQPGTGRLDIGPRVSLNLPVGSKFVSGSLDWRFRVAGSARPGSGPALTLAADF